MTVQERIEAEMVKRWPETRAGLFTPDQVRAVAAAAAEEAVELSLEALHVRDLVGEGRLTVNDFRRARLVVPNDARLQAKADQARADWKAGK